MNSRPKVSVVVPNYNHARYLEQRLDSVFGQTYQNFEVIILDDCSTDHSLEVIKPYTEKENVRFYPNKKNSGTPFAQWERGVSIANGEYIWIAESDDVAEPELLEVLVRLLEENSKIGIAYCQSKRIGPEGEDLGDFHFWTDHLDSERWHSSFTNSGTDECARYLIERNTIPNASAVVFRKTAYSEVGNTPLSYRLCGDWLVWSKMLSRYDIAYSPRLLNQFRIHNQSVRETTKDDLRNAEIRELQRYIAFDLNLPKIDQEKIVLFKLNEFLSLYRSANSNNRISFLKEFFFEYLPYFGLSPLIALKGFWKRHH